MCYICGGFADPCDPSPCGTSEVCTVNPGNSAAQCICAEGFLTDEVDGSCFGKLILLSCTFCYIFYLDFWHLTFLLSVQSL